MAPMNNHKTKLWLHTCSFILMIAVIGVAVYMMNNPVMLGGAPRTPMVSRVGLSLGGKGLVFLLYQILTENVRFFRRMASTKANLILNCIESVGWPAAVGVAIYGMLQFCIGITCTLNYVMIVLAVFISVVSFFSAWISLKGHRLFKATGQKPGEIKLESMNSEDSNKAFNTGGNAVTILSLPDKAPEPIQQSPAYSAAGQSYGWTPPYQQRQHCI